MSGKINPNWLRGIGFVLILVLAYFFLIFIPDKELDKNHKYTIGTIREFEMPSDGDELAKFYYRVKGREYYNFFTIIPDYQGKFKIGSRIFVKFSPTDPKHAKIIYERTVPASLMVPDEGWNNIPK